MDLDAVESCGLRIYRCCHEVSRNFCDVFLGGRSGYHPGRHVGHSRCGDRLPATGVLRCRLIASVGNLGDAGGAMFLHLLGQFVQTSDIDAVM